MEGMLAKELRILQRDQEGNLRPNKGIAIAQKITVNWGKDKIQKAYNKDAGAKELNRKKETNDNVQQREGILYWKGRIYIFTSL